MRYRVYNIQVPEFRYECIDSHGKKNRGKLTSESRESVVGTLKSRGMVPISVKEVLPVTPAYAPGLGGVSVTRLSIFTRKLAQLVKTDIPISQIFDILSREEEGSLLCEAARHVGDRITGGKGLGESMSERPRVFSKLYIRMVEAGMNSGTLELVAENLANMYEAESAFRKKLLGKLAYPAFLVLFTVAVVIFMHSLVINGQRMLSDEMFTGILVVWFIIGLLGVFGMTRPGYAIYRRIGFMLPGIGNLMRKINLARFCRIFGLQYAAGVPINEGLDVAKEVLQDPALERGIHGMRQRINKGMDLREAMVTSGVFPHQMISMVGTGEAAGGVDKMLLKLAEYYDQDVDTGTSILGVVLYFVAFIASAATVIAVIFELYLKNYIGPLNDFMDSM